MTGFEAAESAQPQDHHCRKGKFEDKRSASFIWAVVVLFILVVFLCANSFILINLYHKTQSELASAYAILNNEKLKKEELATADTVLLDRLQKLTEENRLMKEDYKKTSRGNSDLSVQLEILQKKNNELSKQNKSLVDDNVALQNSLKMAASVGVKPQNFSIFEGLNARNTINRGKYIGKFLGTAYTPSKEECGNDRGITNSGKAIIPGVTIAVDKNYWPFGTVFYIKGLGYTVAMDSGSSIKGKDRFDFSVFDKEFAKMLGSRKWEVYLVKLGKGVVNNIKL